MKPVKIRYRIEIEALADDPRPGPVRLRSLLKFALRACRLRCVTLNEVKPVPLNAEPKEPG